MQTVNPPDLAQAVSAEEIRLETVATNLMVQILLEEVPLLIFRIFSEVIYFQNLVKKVRHLSVTDFQTLNIPAPAKEMILTIP